MTNYKRTLTSRTTQAFSSSHSGVDKRSPNRSPILSPVAGTVVAIGTGRKAGATDLGWDYGKWIVVRDKAGAYHFFAHCAVNNYLEVGDSVSVGQRIALSGATGNISGAHIHWSVYIKLWVRATLLNPEKYLAAAIKREKAARAASRKSLTRAKVRRVAKVLNRLGLGRRTSAETTGVRGAVYWWLVQRYGKKHTNLYGRGYVVTGIPGARTRLVEAHLVART